MQLLTFQQNSLPYIINILEQGNVIAYPTETVYGLGCDATNHSAVNNIFCIKKRPKEKSLPILVSSLHMLKKYCSVNSLSEQLINKYWPVEKNTFANHEALTLILDTNKKGQKYLCNVMNPVDKSVAVRISGHPIASAIVNALQRPLVSTSANISGHANIFTANDIIRHFSKQLNQPCIVIDGGNLQNNISSTLVDARDGKIKILREGSLLINKMTQ